ncbi:MAG: hypothetical protein LAT65_11095 [Saccharospirillum sp.]|nr:hypothetical protein [Saccharospirillum sp.]
MSEVQTHYRTCNICEAMCGLEVPHYDVFFNAFAVRNTAKFSEPLFEKTANQKHDWEILRDLGLYLTGQEDEGLTPEMLLDGGLKQGAYGDQGMSLEHLKANPHGIDLGPLQPCLE